MHAAWSNDELLRGIKDIRAYGKGDSRRNRFGTIDDLLYSYSFFIWIFCCPYFLFSESVLVT
jgi:hypothetical protein